VIYTLVDRELRARIETSCRELQLPCVPMLDPILKGLSAYLGLESKAQPGRQHTMGEEYFSRLDAMDFALTQDDGQSPAKLDEAHVILVGVSRTSKTPTCIYLANRGIKAANVPMFRHAVAGYTDVGQGGHGRWPDGGSGTARLDPP